MNRKYTVKDDTGTYGTYEISEDEPDTKANVLDPNGYPIYLENTAIPITEAAKLHQQTKSTDDLIAEARSLIEYNKRQKEIIPKQEQKQKQPTVKDFQDSMEDAQRMASLRKKPIYKIPKSIFDAFDY